jgi:hypothetical protein
MYAYKFDLASMASGECESQLPLISFQTATSKRPDVNKANALVLGWWWCRPHARFHSTFTAAVLKTSSSLAIATVALVIYHPDLATSHLLVARVAEPFIASRMRTTVLNNKTRRNAAAYHDPLQRGFKIYFE